MPVKICKICGVSKDTSEFHKHPTALHGVRPECKVCYLQKRNAQIRDKYLTDPDFQKYSKDRNRASYKINGKRGKKRSTAQQLLDMQKYKEKYPEKYKCRFTKYRVLPIIKGNQMHHWSYNQIHYKDCIELTKIQHRLIHRFLKYDQSVFMYRSENDVLLNTKELHTEYINHIIKRECADC